MISPSEVAPAPEAAESAENDSDFKRAGVTAEQFAKLTGDQRQKIIVASAVLGGQDD